MSLKTEMDKKFDREKNYHSIISKIERVSSMKKKRYIFVPTFALAIVVVAIIGYNFIKTPSKTIIISEDDRNIEITLNINEMKELATTSLDADIKMIEIEELPEKFSFMNDINIPEDLKLDNCYNIYTRNSIEEPVYDVLHDYVLDYQTEDNIMRNITIAFSEIDKPLRDYYIDNQELKSKIGDVELEISQYKNMYIVTFSYNNLNFDIETNGITEDELVELLVSIIK